MLSAQPERFTVRTNQPLLAGGSGSLSFTYRPADSLEQGTKLWFIYDIRQHAGPPQARDAHAPNHISATTASSAPVTCEGYGARTLDLYPVLPEFLHVCEITLPAGLAEKDKLTIHLGSKTGPWTFSENPIQAFHFWLIEGKTPARTFEPTGYKTYRKFDPPLDLDVPADQPLVTQVEFTGEYPAFAPG
ncbi:MAG: hypothetical protein O2954_15765, partial [bacterium]|nr:hypothetical protein [bacterium]